MENKKLYLRILKEALGILIILSILTYVLTKEWVYVWSTLFGGMLGVAGFLMILLFTYNIPLEGNVKGKFTSAYLIRYLIYAVAMIIAMQMGLNILSILVGFLCINLAIKLDTFLHRKEEN